MLKVDAITLANLILIKHNKKDCPAWLLAHEKIHISQARELYYIGFWFLYAYDYFRWRIKGLNHYSSYINIRFEIAAYTLSNSKTDMTKEKDND